MKDKKLFIVEFGKPELGFGSMFGFDSNIQQPVYVVANDYNEAASKALAYAQYKKENAPTKSVIGLDGSLRPTNNNENEEIRVRSVKLASEEVIW